MTSLQQQNLSSENNSSQKERSGKHKPSRKLPLPLVASLILTVITVVLAIVTILWQSNSLISQKQDTRSDASSDCSVVVGAGSGEFPTVEAALNSLGNSLAGKVVCVRNNKVYGQTNITNKSGKPGQPLVIKAHPSNTGSNPRPQFKDGSTPLAEATRYRGTIHVRNSNYLTLQGLESAEAPNIGIDIGGSKGIIVRDIVIHDTQTQGIRFIQTEDVLLDGCYIYNYRKSQLDPEGVHLVESNNVVFQNCEVKNMMSKNGAGGTFGILRSTNVIVRNNEVYSPFVGPVLHPDQSQNVTFENNMVINTCGTAGKSTGYYNLDEPYPRQAGATGPWRVSNAKNIFVRNNLIVGGGETAGVIIGGCMRKVGEVPGGVHYVSGPCIAKNIRVENNTVVGSGGTAFIYRTHTDPPQGLTIANNIFHTTGSKITEGSPGSQYFSGNIWSATPFGSKPAGDTVVNNLSGVFASGINPNSCISSLNLNDYKVSSAYAGKGADINKVGVKKSGEIVIAPPNPITPDSTSIPTPTPTSVPTPTPIASPRPPTDPIETPIPTSPPSNTTIVSGNLIQNGSFSPNPYWGVGLGGRLIMEGGAGRYTITNNKEFNQLFQKDISLRSGKTYKLKFSAKSSIPTKVSIGVIKDTSPFTNYANNNSSMRNLSLTTQWKDFTATFTAGNFNGVVTDARFRFEMNNYANNTDFWFKDVVMEEM